jgi:hypothetical protein
LFFDRLTGLDPIDAIDRNFSLKTGSQEIHSYALADPIPRKYLHHGAIANSEPPPQSASDIRLVVEYQLPISMSPKPDFFDYIDKDGSSKFRR